MDGDVMDVTLAASKKKPAKPARAPNAVVILCSSGKGGSAKTTTTRSLASFAARDGYRVATIDLDPQQTLTAWWNRRHESLPSIIHYGEIPIHEAGGAIAELAELGGYDILFVDTPPGIGEATAIKAIIAHSNLVLIPTGDGGEDLQSVSEWMKLVVQEGKAGYFLLCRTDRDLSSLAEAKIYLSDKGDICPHDVRQMQAIKRSYFDGRGAADLVGKPGLRAGEDYRAVWNFVRLKVGLKKKG